MTNNDFREVWVGKDQDTCVLFCLALKDAGIPYRVIQQREAVFKTVDENFSMGVPPQYFDQAKTIIEADNSDLSDDPNSETGTELPAQDDKAPTDVDDEHRDWKDEAPSDARIEVASENNREFASMIVLALRENDIESRISVLPDGSRKIFVTPHDDSRAREIVRELQTEAPPE